MPQFSQYLNERPETLLHPKQLLSVLKDALGNDIPKYRVLEYVYNEGIIDSIRNTYPVSASERTRYIGILQNQYSVTANRAEYAVDFWLSHVTQELLKKAELADVNWDTVVEHTEERSTADDIETSVDNVYPKLFFIRQDIQKNGIRIQWERNPKSSLYEIWRAENNSPFKVIHKGVFPLPCFTDITVESGKRYSYKIREINEEGNNQSYSFYSNTLQICAPSKPLNFEVQSSKIKGNEIALAWPFIYAAKDYMLERKDSPAAEWSVLAITNTTNYSDFISGSNRENYYRVRCRSKDNIDLVSEEIKVEFYK